MAQVQYLRDEGIVGDNMLAMQYEIMLYSNDARLGNLITFDFH